MSEKNAYMNGVQLFSESSLKYFILAFEIFFGRPIFYLN